MPSQRPTEEQTQLAYEGSGGALLRVLWWRQLLLLATVGLSAPWYFVALNRAVYEGARVVGPSRQLRFRFNAEPRDFLFLLPGAALIVLSCGLVLPWFLHRLQKEVLSKSELVSEQGEVVGLVAFEGDPRSLIQVLAPCVLLGLLTMGLYSPWAHILASRYMAERTILKLEDGEWVGNFQGGAWELIRIAVPGALLSALTFGVYSFWTMSEVLQYQLGRTSYALRLGDSRP